MLPGIFIVLSGCNDGKGSDPDADISADTDTDTNRGAKVAYALHSPQINHRGHVVWHRHDGNDHEIFLHQGNFPGFYRARTRGGKGDVLK